MLMETIRLSEEFQEVTLTTFIFKDRKDLTPPLRRAVIVCPGGGYHFLSERESEPIVAKFLSAGFNVFLLRYSVAPDTHGYEPLKQAARAIAHVRSNAEKYRIESDKIFIAGFSAGGHLAASSGILWNSPVLQKEFEGQPEGINRPDGMILSYPVITAGEFAHKGSIENLTGDENYGEELTEEWSLERHVDGTTPPAFIWHTVTDKVVPVQNSLMLADALTKNHISYELHLFPKGPHGFSLATEETANGSLSQVNPHAAHWIDLAIEWIKLQ